MSTTVPDPALSTTAPTDQPAPATCDAPAETAPNLDGRLLGGRWIRFSEAVRRLRRDAWAAAVRDRTDSGRGVVEDERSGGQVVPGINKWSVGP